MLFIKKTENGYEKYLVSFNRKEVEILRLTVIVNCSKVIHEDYTSSEIPQLETPDSKIFNFNSEKIENNEHPTYHFRYDKYIYPYFVSIIDRLLNADSSAISEIYSGIKSGKIDYDEKIHSLHEKMGNTNNLDEKLKYLEQIETLLKQKGSDDDNNNIVEYYLKLQEMITLTKVAEIDCDTVSKVEAFFDKVISN